MSNEARVEFLGWDRPGLAASADRLVDAYRAGGELRLGRVVVALPGARAGRRLAELLAERAGAEGLVLRPGRVVTVGALPELLFAPEGPTAGKAARLSGWAMALAGLEAGTLSALVPTPPEPEDRAGWLALGERVMRLHETLAGAAVRFAEVPERAVAGGLVDFDETGRWAALAAAEAGYERVMAEAGLIDPQLARLAALADDRAALEGDLWLVGVAEMPTLVRRMVERLGDRVTALVQAPADVAERFDRLGTVVAERWADARVELEGAVLRVADGPAGQAGAAVRAIAASGGRYAAEEITVGVCDAEVGPHVQRQLSAFGVDSRVAEGRPIERAGPARLLEAVAAYLPERRFAEFAAMVRHPDLGAWLQQALGPGGEGAGDAGADNAPASGEATAAAEGDAEVGVDAWLRWVDEYYNAHLQQRLIAGWLDEGGRGERMRAVAEAVHGPTLLGGMSGSRRLSAWAGAIGGLLSAVYGGRALRRNHETERSIIESCESIGRTLDELASLPESLDDEATAAEAIALVLRLIEGDAIAPEAERAAVEMLGWLELPLDDAPQLVVTGFNEGRAPESVVGDAFLPDRLRTALGLIDNARRYARDAYALSAIVGSRSDCTLVMGRRAGAGDPLMPSRLLFADEQAVVLDRAQWFYESPTEGEATVARRGAPETEAGQGGTGGVVSPLVFETAGLWPPPPSKAIEPPPSLPVTAFRDYLACPYRFYLRHVMKLRPVDDRAVELDAAGFGNLMHEVVRRFGVAVLGSVVDPTDEGATRSWVLGALEEMFARWYGDRPAPALWVQREQARRRLGDFARWQAEWAGSGWRIEHVEMKVDNAAIEVDGQAMGLRGRIDRIDVNDRTGERLLLDYKTGDRARTPEQTHRKGPVDEKRWVDLQLPLYRTLAAAKGIELIGGVGYVNLPREAGGVGEALAAWEDEDLAAARETAENVVRAIRAKQFYPPADPPPTFDDYAAICGVEQFTPDIEDEDGEEGFGEPGGGA